MSVAFTTIAAGLDWQVASFVNEFQKAFSERRQSIGQSSISNIAEGDDIQSAALWAGWQQWIINYSASFVDPLGTIAGGTIVPMLSWATLKDGSHSGLTSGFRRAITWPSDWTNYSDAAFTASKPIGSPYDVMHTGDIIGPWIFEDLQKVFSWLRWTYISGASMGHTDMDKRESYTRFGFVSCAQTRSDEQALWVATGWSSGAASFFPVGYLAYGYGRDLSSYWQFRDARTRIRFSCGVPTMRPSVAAFYVLPSSAGMSFLDMDSCGFSDGVYCLLEEQAASSVTPRNASVFLGDQSDAPIDASGIACPVPGVGTSIAISCAENDTIAVLKWDFTNA